MKLASAILVVIGLALMAAGVLAGGGWEAKFSRWTNAEKGEPEDLLAP